MIWIKVDLWAFHMWLWGLQKYSWISLQCTVEEFCESVSSLPISFFFYFLKIISPFSLLVAVVEDKPSIWRLSAVLNKIHKIWVPVTLWSSRVLPALPERFSQFFKHKLQKGESVWAWIGIFIQTLCISTDWIIYMCAVSDVHGWKYTLPSVFWASSPSALSINYKM